MGASGSNNRVTMSQKHTSPFSTRHNVLRETPHGVIRLLDELEDDFDPGADGGLVFVFFGGTIGIRASANEPHHTDPDGSKVIVPPSPFAFTNQRPGIVDAIRAKWPNVVVHAASPAIYTRNPGSPDLPQQLTHPANSPPNRWSAPTHFIMENVSRYKLTIELIGISRYNLFLAGGGTEGLGQTGPFIESIANGTKTGNYIGDVDDSFNWKFSTAQTDFQYFFVPGPQTDSPSVITYTKLASNPQTLPYPDTMRVIYWRHPSNTEFVVFPLGLKFVGARASWSVKSNGFLAKQFISQAGRTEPITFNQMEDGESVVTTGYGRKGSLNAFIDGRNLPFTPGLGGFAPNFPGYTDGVARDNIPYSPDTFSPPYGLSFSAEQYANHDYPQYHQALYGS